MANPTFTCVATCQYCHRELLRREGVALDARQDLMLALPDLAVCREADHNTLPDVPQNYGADVRWFREKRSRRGKIIKLIAETQQPRFS